MINPPIAIVKAASNRNTIVSVNDNQGLTLMLISIPFNNPVSSTVEINMININTTTRKPINLN